LTARGGHVKETHQFFVIKAIITTMPTENPTVAIAKAKAKSEGTSIAIHVMQHLVVPLRIARPWFQAILTAAASD